MNPRKCQSEGCSTSILDLQKPPEGRLVGRDIAGLAMIGIWLVFHLQASGREVLEPFRRRLFLSVAMGLKLTKTGSRHVACSCKKEECQNVGSVEREDTGHSRKNPTTFPMVGRQTGS